MFGKSLAFTSSEPIVDKIDAASASKIPDPSILSTISSVPRIAWKDLHRGTLRGNGSYGVVYQGQWFGQDVAIKELQLKTLSDSMTKSFVDEAQIMMSCQFPNITRLFGICTEPGHYAMVMEYLPNSLRERLQEDKPLPWLQLWQIAIDIAEGLAFLHKREIVHRDLKSPNILLDKNNRAKIADFGLAKVKIEIAGSTSTGKKVMGSVRWRAPELFKRNSKATFATDIYSLGMLLWELISRKLPYAEETDEQTVISWIASNQRETIPDDCPEDLANIILSCWETPDKRPSAEYIVERLKQAQSKAKAAAEKIWQFDSTLKPEPSEIKDGYVLINAGIKDTQKVVTAYQQAPVPGYEVSSVKIIFNPTLYSSFADKFKLLQARDGNPAFRPKWSEETDSEWRKTLMKRFESMAAPNHDKDYPAVKLFAGWHGTKRSVLSSIFKTGFANLSHTDDGYFGKGLYSTPEARYAYEVYREKGDNGALLMNWVICFSGYPVVANDMAKLESKANYENYDAHLAGVVPENPKDPDATVFLPCPPQVPPRYHEIVVFDPAQCLATFLVELQPTLPKAPSMLGHSVASSPHAFLATPVTPPKASAELKGSTKEASKVTEAETKLPYQSIINPTASDSIHPAKNLSNLFTETLREAHYGSEAGLIAIFEKLNSIDVVLITNSSSAAELRQLLIESNHFRESMLDDLKQQMGAMAEIWEGSDDDASKKTRQLASLTKDIQQKLIEFQKIAEEKLKVIAVATSPYKSVVGHSSSINPNLLLSSFAAPKPVAELKSIARDLSPQLLKNLTEGDMTPAQLTKDERIQFLNALNIKESVTEFTPLFKVLFLAGQHFTIASKKVRLLETAEWILNQDSSKIDLNALSSIGQTSLHIAVVNGAILLPPLNEKFNDIAKKLIMKGASLDIVNERKESPRQLIDKVKNTTLQDFLNQSGKKFKC